MDSGVKEVFQKARLPSRVRLPSRMNSAQRLEAPIRVLLVHNCGAEGVPALCSIVSGSAVLFLLRKESGLRPRSIHMDGD